jgi:hypothetical protein
MEFQAILLVELFYRFKVLWGFKLCLWMNCSTGSSLMEFQAVFLVELFYRFKVLWGVKLYLWMNCSTGSSLMEFQAVLLVELFYRLKVLWGFKLCLWMNCSAGSSLMRFQTVLSVDGFQGSEGQKCLHIQGSIGSMKNHSAWNCPTTEPHNPQNLPPQPYCRQSTKFLTVCCAFQLVYTYPHHTTAQK